jgi:predicted nucleic acid-binding protein
MGQYFFDTSALVKRYQQEHGTQVVDALFAQAQSSFVISRLGMVETTSALALKVRTGELPLADYAVTRKKFLGDVAQGTLQVVRLLVSHYRRAELLIDRHAPSRRFRTLDALQLCIALDLHNAGRVDQFICADQALCEIALLEGLRTLNPSAAP